MRILGIDFGDRRIGLAVSDRLLVSAQGIGTYEVKNVREDRRFFRELVTKYEIEEVVIGLPLRMDGSLGTRAKKTQEFAQWLEAVLNLPVSFFDERLTTQQAIKILHHHKRSPKAKKELEDQISAVIILSTYLERKRAKSDVGQSR